MCPFFSLALNPTVSSNKDHTLFNGRSNRFINSVSSLLSLYLAPPWYFPWYFFPVFFHPKSLSLQFLFLTIQFRLYFATDDTLSFLPLLSETDWVNYWSLCPILNEHLCFPSATLPVFSRDLCLSESPDNDPWMLFFFQHLSVWEWFKASLWLDSSSSGQEIFLLVQIVIRTLAASA